MKSGKISFSRSRAGDQILLSVDITTRNPFPAGGSVVIKLAPGFLAVSGVRYCSSLLVNGACEASCLNGVNCAVGLKADVAVSSSDSGKEVVLTNSLQPTLSTKSDLSFFPSLPDFGSTDPLYIPGYDGVRIAFNISAVLTQQISGYTGLFDVLTRDADGVNVDRLTTYAETRSLQPNFLRSTQVAPLSLASGQVTGLYVRFENYNPIPHDGKVQISLPPSFDLSNVRIPFGVFPDSSSTKYLNGNIYIASVSKSSVLLSLADLNQPIAATTRVRMFLNGVRNPLAQGWHSMPRLQTQSAAGVAIDEELQVLGNSIVPAVMQQASVSSSSTVVGIDQDLKFSFSVRELSGRYVRISLPPSFTFSSLNKSIPILKLTAESWSCENGCPLLASVAESDTELLRVHGVSPFAVFAQGQQTVSIFGAGFNQQAAQVTPVLAGKPLNVVIQTDTDMLVVINDAGSYCIPQTSDRCSLPIELRFTTPMNLTLSTTDNVNVTLYKPLDGGACPNNCGGPRTGVCSNAVCTCFYPYTGIDCSTAPFIRKIFPNFASSAGGAVVELLIRSDPAPLFDLGRTYRCIFDSKIVTAVYDSSREVLLCTVPPMAKEDAILVDVSVDQSLTCEAEGCCFITDPCFTGALSGRPVLFRYYDAAAVQTEGFLEVDNAYHAHVFSHETHAGSDLPHAHIVHVGDLISGTVQDATRFGFHLESGHDCGQESGCVGFMAVFEGSDSAQTSQILSYSHADRYATIAELAAAPSRGSRYTIGHYLVARSMTVDRSCTCERGSFDCHCISTTGSHEHVFIHQHVATSAHAHMLQLATPAFGSPPPLANLSHTKEMDQSIARIFAGDAYDLVPGQSVQRLLDFRTLEEDIIRPNGLDLEFKLPFNLSSSSLSTTTVEVTLNISNLIRKRNSTGPSGIFAIRTLDYSQQTACLRSARTCNAVVERGLLIPSFLVSAGNMTLSVAANATYAGRFCDLNISFRLQNALSSTTDDPAYLELFLPRAVQANKTTSSVSISSVPYLFSIMQCSSPNYAGTEPCMATPRSVLVSDYPDKFSDSQIVRVELGQTSLSSSMTHNLKLSKVLLPSFSRQSDSFYLRSTRADGSVIDTGLAAGISIHSQDFVSISQSDKRIMALTSFDIYLSTSSPLPVGSACKIVFPAGFDLSSAIVRIENSSINFNIINSSMTFTFLPEYLHTSLIRTLVQHVRNPEMVGAVGSIQVSILFLDGSQWELQSDPLTIVESQFKYVNICLTDMRTSVVANITFSIESPFSLSYGTNLRIEFPAGFMIACGRQIGTVQYADGCEMGLEVYSLDGKNCTGTQSCIPDGCEVASVIAAIPSCASGSAVTANISVAQVTNPKYDWTSTEFSLSLERRGSVLVRGSSSPITTVPGSHPSVKPAQPWPAKELQAIQACSETRSWEELMCWNEEEAGRMSTGGLGGQLVENQVEVWACFKNEACLKALSAAMEDWICYVYEEIEKEWIVWGLNSELQLLPPV
eukprot:750335-Hanusia_phi.AAC.3